MRSPDIEIHRDGPTPERESSKPLISVIMATYNAESVIKRAIDSVKAQSYDKWELIIINDASADKTAEVIASETVGISDKVKSVTRKENGGPGASRKDGCDVAEGEVIAILDGDDALHTEALERCVEAYSKNPGIGIVFTDHYQCDSNMNIVRTARWGGEIKPDSPAEKGRNITHLATFKKSVYEMTSGYSDKYRRATDRVVYYELLRYSRAVRIAQPLYFYRRVATPTQMKEGERNDKDLKSKAMARDKGVSIIIPHKDRLENLLIAVESISGTEDHEIIIVDGSDFPIEIEGTRNIHTKETFSRSKYLNMGARAAKYNRLFFTDADIIFPEGFISRIIEKTAYNAPYFPIVRNESGRYFKYHSEDGWRMAGYGMLGIMSRDFWHIGGYDEEFTEWGGEDNAIYWKTGRAGMKKTRDKSGLIHIGHPPATEDPDIHIRKNRILFDVQRKFLMR